MDTYLHCRVPRIKSSTGEVKLIDIPWARSGSGFTLLFEAFVMKLIECEMPINKVGATVREDSHRIWTIFNHWVKQAYAKDKPSIPTTIGLDETSRRKGHNYITVAVDMKERRVIHVTEGKDKSTIASIKKYLESKSVNIKKIKHASMDMSPSFIAGVKENFPKAEIHFDRFHVVKLLNEALDKVRQAERKEHSELKGHKYTFLKNHSNLSEQKREELSELITLFPKLGEAYRLKELFNDLWDMDDEDDALNFVADWC